MASDLPDIDAEPFRLHPTLSGMATRRLGAAIWLGLACTVIAAGTLALHLRTGLAVDAVQGAAPATPDLADLHASIATLRDATRDSGAWLLATALALLACGAIALGKLMLRRDRPADTMPQQPNLAAMNRRYAAALETLSQGVVILDPAYRLVASNQILNDFYPVDGKPIAPGMDLADIISRNVVEGHHPGQTAANLLAGMRRRLAAGVAFEYRHHVSAGHVVIARWRPLEDGGWCGAFEDITEQHRSKAKIAHMARHDGLTDLVNRPSFEQAVGRALARARRGENFAVLAISINRFKPVIDALGYTIGDQLLTAVARRLRNAVREVDSVARLASDEFAILQAGIGQPEDADAMVQRIGTVLTEPYRIAGSEIVISVSIGIALGGSLTNDGEEVIRNATLALHRARQENGRQAGTCVHRFFEPGMEAHANARRRLETDLRLALAAGEFELFYQPLINLGQRRVCAFEALLRWRHPTRGLVPPDAFIPLAEELGLIVPIGAWVLRTACAEAMRWQVLDGGAELRVAVNLSAVQFRSPGLLEAVKTALADSGLPGDRLELEITESVLLQDNDLSLQILHQLRALGARISMDDFGTGYSSLGYLRSFPFDKLKIDKSFIHGLTDDSGNPSAGADAIIRAIAGLGQTLGISTTAEGVETQAQLERMIAVGCTEAQGYFFSPPRPASDVPALILAPLAPLARQAA